MAVTSGLAQDLWVGGSKLSGDVGVINSLSSPVAEINTTPISASAFRRLQGLVDGSLEFVPFFNDAAGAAHPVLSALPSTDVLMLYATGQSIDARAFSLAAKQANYDWTRAIDGELQGNVLGSNANGIAPEWMVMFTASSDTQSSSGTTPSKNDGAATSDGLAAVLHIESIASGTPTVTIEESSDDGGGDAFVTLVAFSAVASGAEPSAERVTVSGAVEQYLRLNITGTFTDLVYAMAYRRGESVDRVAYA